MRWAWGLRNESDRSRSPSLGPQLLVTGAGCGAANVRRAPDPRVDFSVVTLATGEESPRHDPALRLRLGPPPQPPFWVARSTQRLGPTPTQNSPPPLRECS